MSQSLGLTPAVQSYILAHNRAEHPALTACRDMTASHPRVVMQISPEQGHFMAGLIRLIDARLAVEVGVFTGYSALVTALALRDNAGPGAKLFGLDISTEYTDLAKPFWADAGVEDVIDLRIAPASASMAALVEEGYGNRIDFIFVDADKPGYDDYYEWGLKLLHVGGVMLFDNMLWSGRVADEGHQSEEVNALRALAAKGRDDPRVDCTFFALGDGLMMVTKR